MTIADAYKVLGLDPSRTTREEARARFHDLIRANHPDRKPSHERPRANEVTLRIIEAYGRLQDADSESLARGSRSKRKHSRSAARVAYHDPSWLWTKFANGISPDPPTPGQLRHHVLSMSEPCAADPALYDLAKKAHQARTYRDFGRCAHDGVDWAFVLFYSCKALDRGWPERTYQYEVCGIASGGRVFKFFGRASVHLKFRGIFRGWIGPRNFAELIELDNQLASQERDASPKAFRTWPTAYMIKSPEEFGMAATIRLLRSLTA